MLFINRKIFPRPMNKTKKRWNNKDIQQNIT